LLAALELRAEDSMPPTTEKADVEPMPVGAPDDQEVEKADDANTLQEGQQVEE
jgi:hypothetical protein